MADYVAEVFLMCNQISFLPNLDNEKLLICFLQSNWTFASLLDNFEISQSCGDNLDFPK